MDFLTLAKARYSVRKLSEQPVEQEKIEKILEACNVAPTGENKQPFKIWVMQSEGSREKVVSTTSMRFIRKAPVIFVIGAESGRAWVRPFDNLNIAVVDASIVATHLMLEVHDLGLGTCWVGLFDPAQLKSLFPQMEPYELIGIFGVGYPAENSVPIPLHDKFRPRDEIVEML